MVMKAIITAQACAIVLLFLSAVIQKHKKVLEIHSVQKAIREMRCTTDRRLAFPLLWFGAHISWKKGTSDGKLFSHRISLLGLLAYRFVTHDPGIDSLSIYINL
jgi:hypothetical protein